MNQPVDLDKLLSQMASDQGRVEVIRKMVGKVALTDEHCDFAIGYLEEADRTDDAADLAVRAGRSERAVEVYENAGRLVSAARLAQDCSMAAKAGELYEKAVAELEEGGDVIDAAEVAEEAGMTAKAIELYVGRKRLKDATRVALDAGWTSRAVEIYEEAGKYGDAGALAEEQGEVMRAIDNYERAGMLDDAVEVARGLKLVDRAVSIFEKAGRPADAARIAEEHGDAEKAVQLYEKAGMPSVAAEVARKSGLIDYAIGVYKRAGKEQEARKLSSSSARKMGDVQRQTRLIEKYEKAGRIADAYRVAQEAGLTEQMEFYGQLLAAMGETPPAKKRKSSRRSRQVARGGKQKVTPAPRAEDSDAAVIKVEGGQGADVEFPDPASLPVIEMSPGAEVIDVEPHVEELGRADVLKSVKRSKSRMRIRRMHRRRR